LTWPGELTLLQLAVVTCSVRLPEGEELNILPVTRGLAEHEAFADTGFVADVKLATKIVEKERTAKRRRFKNNLARIFILAVY
jgi:hypothetical protein